MLTPSYDVEGLLPCADRNEKEKLHLSSIISQKTYTTKQSPSQIYAHADKEEAK
jgi:hypothetical protein